MAKLRRLPPLPVSQFAPTAPNREVSEQSVEGVCRADQRLTNVGGHTASD